jgi:hypothetical protein
LRRIPGDRVAEQREQLGNWRGVDGFASCDRGRSTRTVSLRRADRVASGGVIEFEFSGEVWEWRGPAPFYFVSVPDEESADIDAIAGEVSYGWGCIPVSGRIGRTSFTTALIPKDGLYALPLKVAVRRPERIELGDTITVTLTVGATP